MFAGARRSAETRDVRQSAGRQHVRQVAHTRLLVGARWQNRQGGETQRRPCIRFCSRLSSTCPLLLPILPAPLAFARGRARWRGAGAGCVAEPGCTATAGARAVPLLVPSPPHKQPNRLLRNRHFSVQAWLPGESQRAMLLCSRLQLMRLADVPAVTTAAAHSRPSMTQRIHMHEMHSSRGQLPLTCDTRYRKRHTTARRNRTPRLHHMVRPLSLTVQGRPHAATRACWPRQAQARPQGRAREGARRRQTDSAGSHRAALGPSGKGGISKQQAALDHAALGVTQQRDTHHRTPADCLPVPLVCTFHLGIFSTPSCLLGEEGRARSRAATHDTAAQADNGLLGRQERRAASCT
jgi:hypothetical protein